MKIASIDQMRVLDKQAASRFGIPEQLLMENAGAAAAIVLQKKYDPQVNRFLIICGSGNNGGDGLVVARKLHSNLAQVEVVIFGSPAKYHGAALQNYHIVKKLKIKVIENPGIQVFRRMITASDVLVDALFGTGLDREVGGIYRDVIQAINKSRRPVASLDIPSGVGGNTGQLMGVAIKAEITITFGLPKYGNLLYPGCQNGGRLWVTHISFPPEMYNTPSIRVETNDPVLLPPRPEDAHKGSCGKVLFISGAANYLGAPYFAASAFLRTGGGLAYLATPEQVAPFIGTQGHEIVFVPQKATQAGTIARTNLDSLLKFSEQVDMVVLGPGLSLETETQNLVRDLVVRLNKPLLIDGDGLTAVAYDPGLLKKRKAPTVLTPHPGEMARLMTGRKISEESTDRIGLLKEQAKNLASIIVLKGAHTLIGYPDGAIRINMSGNAGMATAGSGDVLTGVIAGLFGIGCDFNEAVRMGVFIHGLAGDIAAQNVGEDGLIAGDILASIAPAMKRMRNEFRLVYAECNGKISVL
jgi:hydroxyethylthiazole kinase-like uncharacterized protein yjeF